MKLQLIVLAVHVGIAGYAAGYYYGHTRATGICQQAMREHAEDDRRDAKLMDEEIDKLADAVKFFGERVEKDCR